MEYKENIAKMNATEYKKYHEAFMENNNGTSAHHVFFCIFFTVQCSIFSAIRQKYPQSNAYVSEYIIIVLPLITAHTILAEYIYILNIIILLLILYELSQHDISLKKKFSQHNINNKNRIKSITYMRGLTYLITVLCILAVDFKSFPRFLAKTERYGYSLMDTGVGLFVLMSGLTHKDLRNNKITKILYGNINFVTILVFLGVARYFSVKQLNYQEHVTEYGVHWNFFFTLAVCKVLSTILLFYSNHDLILSFVILTVHEFILYNYLQDWVFSNIPRDSILSANREGISSCLGYISLYMFAAHLKKMLCDRTAHKYTIQIKLILGSIFLWTLLYVINIYRPASRVLANACFCVYLESVLVTVLSVLYFFEALLQYKNKNNFHVPLILLDINLNGLLYFLVSNLATGAINLSMRTLLASSILTFVILNVYMVITLAVAVCLLKRGFRM